MDAREIAARQPAAVVPAPGRLQAPMPRPMRRHGRRRRHVVGLPVAAGGSGTDRRRAPLQARDRPDIALSPPLAAPCRSSCCASCLPTGCSTASPQADLPAGARLIAPPSSISARVGKLGWAPCSGAGERAGDRRAGHGRRGGSRPRRARRRARRRRCRRRRWCRPASPSSAGTRIDALAAGGDGAVRAERGDDRPAERSRQAP